MIVRIEVYLSSLLLAIIGKFHFAKILITPYILRNDEKQVYGYVLVFA